MVPPGHPVVVEAPLSQRGTVYICNGIGVCLVGGGTSEIIREGEERRWEIGGEREERERERERGGRERRRQGTNSPSLTRFRFSLRKCLFL